jgi:hypothetical protein
MKNSNYTKWASFFKSMRGKFGLQSHIDGSSPARPDDPQWYSADCCARTWLFSSVDDSVLDLAMEGDDQTARTLWTTIERLFRANKEPRTIFLAHEFHSIKQGDSSISDYAQRMKNVADSLRDVSHGVPESQLVLNLLGGVNERFTNTVDDIANAPVLPNFARARDILILKELRLANGDRVAAGTAHVAGSGASGCTNPGGCRSTSFGPIQDATGGRAGRWEERRRRRHLRRQARREARASADTCDPAARRRRSFTGRGPDAPRQPMVLL